MLSEPDLARLGEFAAIYPVQTSTSPPRAEPSRTWSLHWPDRNGRWHPYPAAEPTAEIDWLLRELDVDPHGAFWG